MHPGTGSEVMERMNGIGFVYDRARIDAAVQPPAVAPGTGIAGRRLSFAEILGRSTPSSEGQTPGQRARSGAEQLVAVALVQPLLKQLRETSRAAPPFAPNQAEMQLRALQDATLAHQLVVAGRFPLVEQVARKMLAGATNAAKTPGTEGGP